MTRAAEIRRLHRRNPHMRRLSPDMTTWIARLHAHAYHRDVMRRRNGWQSWYRISPRPLLKAWVQDAWRTSPCGPCERCGRINYLARGSGGWECDHGCEGRPALPTYTEDVPF